MPTALPRRFGLDQYRAELLPEGKVEALEEFLRQAATAKGKVVFVGDGINDSPVIARADVGMAMGGLGSDAAIETADVVIMTDAPSKVAEAILVAVRWVLSGKTSSWRWRLRRYSSRLGAIGLPPFGKRCLPMWCGTAGHLQCGGRLRVKPVDISR